MDDKTAALRDIFVDVTGSESVTERQSESRGSISTDDEEIDARIRAVLEEVDARYDVDTELSTGDLVEVVRSFFAGQDDEAIASSLGSSVDPTAVADARIQLHLLTEADLDGPLEEGDLHARLDEGESLETIAADLGVEPSTLRRYARALEVQRKRQRVGDRFRQSFKYAMGDLALSRRLTADVKEDGLEDATEDIETNVSF